MHVHCIYAVEALLTLFPSAPKALQRVHYRCRLIYRMMGNNYPIEEAINHLLAFAGGLGNPLYQKVLGSW